MVCVSHARGHGSIGAGGCHPPTSGSAAHQLEATAAGPRSPLAAAHSLTKSPIHCDSPLAADELMFLTEFLNDCKSRVADFEAATAASAAGSSSSWRAPDGVLALQDAEAAGQLIEQLTTITRGFKHELHKITIMVGGPCCNKTHAECVDSCLFVGVLTVCCGSGS